MIVLEH